MKYISYLYTPQKCNNMRKQINLTCPECNKEYSKDLSEYNRNIKKRRSSYCSLECASKTNFRRNPIKSNFNISKYAANNVDMYTDFRYVFKSLKSRMHKKCEVSLNDLKEVWELQKGVCPYTGIKLKLIKHGYRFQDITDERFEIASLDRIDSSKGYEKNNLCFVSTMINFMKNNMSVESSVKFLFIIKEFLKDKTDNDIVCAVKKFTEL